MTGEDLISYIQQELRLDASAANELRKLSETYPWFHTPRLLLLRHLKDTGSPLFDGQFSRTAAYLHGRELLFSLLLSSPNPIHTEAEISSGSFMTAEKTEDKETIIEIAPETEPIIDEEPTLEKNIANVVARQALFIKQEIPDDFELEI